MSNEASHAKFVKRLKIFNQLTDWPRWNQDVPSPAGTDKFWRKECIKEGEKPLVTSSDAQLHIYMLIDFYLYLLGAQQTSRNVLNYIQKFPVFGCKKTPVLVIFECTVAVLIYSKFWCQGWLSSFITCRLRALRTVPGREVACGGKCYLCVVV